MKEMFIVTRLVINQHILKAEDGIDLFININPNSPDGEPPMFDTYDKAQGWIKNNGIKAKWYQIQKILMPI